MSTEPPYIEMTPEQGRALFDERARRHLGMSGPEFIAAYDAGLLDEEDPHVGHLVMLLPFARLTGLIR